MASFGDTAIIAAWLACASFFLGGQVAGYRYLRERGLAATSFVDFLKSVLLGDVVASYQRFYRSFGSESGYPRAALLCGSHLLSFPLLVGLALAL